MKEQKKNKFSIKMQKKLVVLFGIVLLAFVCLSARLLVLARDKDAVSETGACAAAV